MLATILQSYVERRKAAGWWGGGSLSRKQRTWPFFFFFFIANYKNLGITLFKIKHMNKNIMQFDEFWLICSSV